MSDMSGTQDLGLGLGIGLGSNSSSFQARKTIDYKYANTKRQQ